jgi:chorismate mutase/prephenate dehydratase
MSDHDELARIRAAVEHADDALAAALDARARAVRALVALRERDPAGHYALSRGPDVVGRIRERIREFPASSVEPVLREVLSACDALARPLRVAYAGAEGGLAHEAARRRFGASAELFAVDDIAATVDLVDRGDALFGIVPLETTVDGSVAATLDALVASEARVTAELQVPVAFHLASRTGHANDFDKLYGTAVAHQQCERWLRATFPHAAVIDVPTPIVAAQLAADDHGAAAITTALVAESFGLTFVREHIEDTRGIQVRFAVIGGDAPARTGADRTVLAVALHDSPGAFHRALAPYAERGVNLTRIETRPARGEPWRYVFVLELDGHVDDPAVLAATDSLRAASRSLKLLGSYPRPV